MNWIAYRDSGRWLAEAVPYFRALGFFQHLQSDAAVIAAVRAYHGLDWDETIGAAPDLPTADLWLLIADPGRVWFRDLECVYRGAAAYAETLREWSRISRGIFTPEQIAEDWVSDVGPVNVSFCFAGQQQTLVHADGHDDFINLELLRLINSLLRWSDYRFAASDHLGDCRFITVLSRKEQRRIQRDRGWRFCDFLMR